MGNSRRFQFGLPKPLLWTAVVAAAGLAVWALDRFGLVASFRVVAGSPQESSVATWLSQLSFAVFLVACAAGFLWFCLWSVMRRRKNHGRDSANGTTHD